MKTKTERFEVFQWEHDTPVTGHNKQETAQREAQRRSLLCGCCILRKIENGFTAWEVEYRDGLRVNK
jgi:hypothetical protein